MRTLVALGIALLVVLTAGPAQGHTGPYDMKYVDGSNLILLTFNTHQPVSGLDIEHNIRLYDLVGAPITYDEVHVEVHTRENTAGAFAQQSSLLYERTLPMLPTNESKMTFDYPVSGSYTLRTVFSSDGREISRGEYALDIGKGSSGPGRSFGVWSLGAAFLLGVALTLLIRRRRPTPDHADSPEAMPVTEEPSLPVAP